MKAVGAFVLVALLASCGGGGTLHFGHAAGWRVLEAHGELVAANVAFARADRSLAWPPMSTVASLPKRGVLLWMTAVRRRHKWPEASFPAVRLSVANAQPTNTPDGFPCARAVHCLSVSPAIRYVKARLSRWDVALTIFFGTEHPSAAQVAAANAELARLTT